MAAAIVRNYAQVLYELSVPQEDIAFSQQVWEENDSLRQVLNHPILDSKTKNRVIDRIFPEKMRRFMKVVCENQRTMLIPDIFAEYENYKNAKEKKLVAVLRYVDAPEKEQEDGICNFLKQKYEVDQVLLEKRQEQDLIGGFILQVGSYEYDWSLKGRMNRLEQKITGR